MPLSILPLPSSSVTEPVHINENLPHGSGVLLAPSNSGKTVWLVNVLTRLSFGLAAHYDVIFVYSPTLDMDQNWDFVRELTPRVVKRGRKKQSTARMILDSEFSVGKIETILDAQEQVPTESRKKVLIVCDDCADQLANDKILHRLFFRGRHARVWCLLSVQSVKSVPRAIRLNTPYWAIWKVSQNELDVLVKEIAVEDPARFKSIFKQATDPQYGFLTINTKASYAKRLYSIISRFKYSPTVKIPCFTRTSNVPTNGYTKPYHEGPSTGPLRIFTKSFMTLRSHTTTLKRG